MAWKSPCLEHVRQFLPSRSHTRSNSDEALLTRFESGRITPPPSSDTVREREKRDAWTAFLTVGAASLAWMLAKPIPPPVGSLSVNFSATHRPRKWLESSAPLGLAVSGFFIGTPVAAFVATGVFHFATHLQRCKKIRVEGQSQADSCCISARSSSCSRCS